MKIYYPYPSDKPEKKYYIITKDNKRVYFGAAGYSDFTQHKDEEREELLFSRNFSKRMFFSKCFWKNVFIKILD